MGKIKWFRTSQIVFFKTLVNGFSRTWLAKKILPERCLIQMFCESLPLVKRQDKQRVLKIGMYGTIANIKTGELAYFKDRYWGWINKFKGDTATTSHILDYDFNGYILKTDWLDNPEGRINL